MNCSYNSVVFNTLSANDYEAALVTEDFLAGGWWNETRVRSTVQAAAYQSSRWRGLERSGTDGDSLTASLQNLNAPWITMYADQLHYMQKNVGSLKRLENSECLQAYATSSLESEWRNVLVVSDIESNDNAIAMWTHSPISLLDDETWVCNYHEPCNVEAIHANPSSWTIGGPGQCSNEDQVQFPGDCLSVPVEVKYCLAEYWPPQCTVRISTYLLMVVIGCNMLKVGCLLITLWIGNFRPLVTIGDAVASYLNDPELATRDVGPLSIMQVKGTSFGCCQRRAKRSAAYFSVQSRRWARAVSWKRWSLCMLLYASHIIAVQGPR